MLFTWCVLGNTLLQAPAGILVIIITDQWLGSLWQVMTARVQI